MDGGLGLLLLIFFYFYHKEINQFFIDIKRIADALDPSTKKGDDDAESISSD